MPHVLLEYSANLADRTDIDGLVHAVHQRALATGIAPLAGLRTRAAERRHYEVADGAPANAFLAVTARLAAGRVDDDRQRFLDELLDAVVTHLGAAEEDVAISVEYQEIDPHLRRNRNNLRARLDQ